MRTDAAVWLLAAWSLVLARLSGQPDLVIGVAQSADSEPGAVPLRVRVDAGSAGQALVTSIATDVAELEPHRFFPVASLALQLHGSIKALSQAMFTVQGHPLWPAGALPGVERSAFPVSEAPAELHLIVPVDLSQGFRLRYATAHFDVASARRILEQFLTAAASLLSDPQRPVSALAMLSPAQREEVVVRFNDTEAVLPADLLMHRPVEERAAQRPDAPALFGAGQTLSYRELNGRANRLAHALLALGVKPDDRVAICLERNPFHGGIDARRAQGGRHLRTAGPGLPCRTTRLHGAGLCTGRPSHRHGHAVTPAANRRPGDCARSCRHLCTASGLEPRRNSPRTARWTFGLPDLHLGVDRPTQRRFCFPSGPRQLAELVFERL